MESKRSKTVSILMMCVLMLVAACSSTGGKDGNNNGEGGGKKGEQPVQSDAANEGGQNDGTENPLKLSVQLESWGSGVPSDDLVLEEIERRTNTDLTVNWINYTDYEERFNVQLSSQEFADVVATVMPSGSLYSPQVIKGIKAGAFHDLTPYIEDPSFDAKYPHLASYDKEVWDMLKFQGKIYGLPRYLQPLASNSAVIIRQDLMEKAGIAEEPKTVEELGDFIIKIAQETGVYGLQTSTKNLDHDNYKPISVAFTGIQDWDVDDEGNFRFQSYVPEYRDFLLWMKKLYDAKAIDPEFALEQKGSQFSEGNSAVMIHVWWNWKQSETDSPFNSETRAKNPEARAWGLMPIQGPKAYAATMKPFNRPALISKKVLEADIPRILALFDYTASAEHRELADIGIEGVHHEVKDGAVVVNNDKIKEDQVGHWYVLFQNQLQTADILIEDGRNKGVSEGDLDRMRAMHEESDRLIKESGLGHPHWSVESPAYFSKWGFVTKDLNDNRIKVIMGQMTIEEWDQYVQTVLNSKDYKQIVAEMKESYLSARQ